MKSFVLLFCLAQLCHCLSLPNGLSPAYRQLNCDDPETEQAALLAVDYINSHIHQGYKHVLNQIDKVQVWAQVSEPAVHELKEPVRGAQLGVSKDHISQHK